MPGVPPEVELGFKLHPLEPQAEPFLPPVDGGRPVALPGADVPREGFVCVRRWLNPVRIQTAFWVLNKK